MIIDAKDLILGRISTYAAKKALLGEDINVINCEKAIITGDKKVVFAKYKRFREMGIPSKGPFLFRMPDRFVKRTIRGMLAYKKPRGRDAFKKIKCYIAIPDQFKDKKTEELKGAHISKVPSLKYITVGEICKLMGGKF